ncbi:hypothetical protein [Cytobacillus purgationiresistens]|uniref:Uncharacterized protein n=1 Tax=Cytobacillus purgationiresistens TaxID=863449 RepID=A0ABU0AP25_9BACI|nr:hypothetical protein [Cytobacillus purgationiresistens]MDQ0272614.1 hypothetical protein [Cytobacillus purgationiresistens]
MIAGLFGVIAVRIFIEGSNVYGAEFDDFLYVGILVQFTEK